MIFDGWDTRLLATLGITPTAARKTFLDAWAKCEGGRAKHNPLNTTYELEPSTDYNKVGVKNYADSVTGICATAMTLRLPYYADLRAALGARGLTAKQIATRGEKNIAKWGTNPECVLRLLGQRPTRN